MRTDLVLAGQLFSVSAIAATVFTPAWIYVGRRLGKTRTYSLSLLLSALAALPALFLPSSLYWMLFGILFLAGAIDASNQLMPNSMVPDTVEVDELQTGQRREGAIFGAWAFCRKLGMATGAFLVSLGLNFVGYIPGEVAAGEQSATAIIGIRIIYAVVPFVLWVTALFLLRKYDLNEERFEAIKQEIEQNAQSAKASN